MGFLIGVIVVLTALFVGAALIDRKARRRGVRLDSSGLSRDLREMRRDVRAWNRGTTGNAGEHDVSWMKHFRRSRRDP